MIAGTANSLAIPATASTAHANAQKPMAIAKPLALGNFSNFLITQSWKIAITTVLTAYAHAKREGRTPATVVANEVNPISSWL